MSSATLHRQPLPLPPPSFDAFHQQQQHVTPPTPMQYRYAQQQMPNILPPRHPQSQPTTPPRHAMPPPHIPPPQPPTSAVPARPSDPLRMDSPMTPSPTRENDSDDAGLIHIVAGELIENGRYRVLGLAGQGTFGTVIDCYDNVDRIRVAIKVVRSVQRYLDAAHIEINILEKINAADTQQNSLCVRLLRHFTMIYNNNKHVCLVFEKLGRSLYEFIKKNHYRGFILDYIKLFAKQIITAVAFCHQIGLTHTDLKPENILLVNSEYTKIPVNNGEEEYRIPINPEVRLIDFGGATFTSDHHSRIVNTRQYRAPEVLLGLGWGHASDMWSVGCILAELFSGELLFGTHEDLEHLALMERVLQEHLPVRMGLDAVEPYKRSHSRSRSRSRRPYRSTRNHRASRSRSASPVRSHSYSHSRSRSSSRRSSSQPRADKLLHLRSGRLRWPDSATSRQSIHVVQQTQSLANILMSAHDDDFIDLIRRCLTFEPANRITAKAALQHPFITGHRHQPAPSTPYHLVSAPIQSQQITVSRNERPQNYTQAAPPSAVSSYHYDRRDRRDSYDRRSCHRYGNDSYRRPRISSRSRSRDRRRTYHHPHRSHVYDRYDDNRNRDYHSRRSRER